MDNKKEKLFLGNVKVGFSENGTIKALYGDLDATTLGMILNNQQEKLRKYKTKSGDVKASLPIAIRLKRDETGFYIEFNEKGLESAPKKSKNESSTSKEDLPF